MTLHRVGLNPSGLSYFVDGDPRIRLGTWFFSRGGLNVGWTCDGARVYLAAGTPTGRTLRAYAILWNDPANLPSPNAVSLGSYVRSGDLVTDGVTGWHEVSWAPLAFTDWPNNLLFIYYEFLDAAAGDYYYAAAGNSPTTPIQSNTLPGLWCAGPGDTASAARSWYAQNAAENASASAASSGMTVWYGSEIVVNDNLGGPPTTGAATFGHAWDVQVTGEAPVLAVPQGGATLNHTWDVQATGEEPEVLVPVGRATLTTNWTVTARGETPDDGGVPTPPRPINDVDVLPVMESMLACLCDALVYAPGGLPCACNLLPGDQVAMDYCDCSSPQYGCGQAWVRLDQSVSAASIYNSVYARKAINTSRCVGLMAHRMQIGVTRCAPGMATDGTPPDGWQYHDAVTQQLGDFAAMRRALDCCLPLDKRREWLFERYQPIGPMGNCVGGYIVMNFRII